VCINRPTYIFVLLGKTYVDKPRWGGTEYDITRGNTHDAGLESIDSDQR